MFNQKIKVLEGDTCGSCIAFEFFQVSTYTKDGNLWTVFTEKLSDKFPIGTIFNK
jgi:hypothetical protein